MYQGSFSVPSTGLLRLHTPERMASYGMNHLALGNRVQWRIPPFIWAPTQTPSHLESSYWGTSLLQRRNWYLPWEHSCLGNQILSPHVLSVELWSWK